MRRFALAILALCSLSAVYAKSESLKVALLTDLHITPGNYNDSIMANLVEDINGQYYDLVVVAGDITNMGSDEELKCAHNHLSRITHRQIVTHGNHETTWSQSGGKDFEKYWGHNGCTTVTVGNYLFVAYPAGPFIKMADGTAQDGHRLAWVEKQLRKAGKRDIISICHYPLNDDLTNRREIVSLLKKYNVSASLAGHYHEPRLMNFDSLPGIVGRSLMLPTENGRNYGYTVLTLKNDSIFVAEKLIGEVAVDRYAIRQRRDSTIDNIKPDPQPEQLSNGNFVADEIISDNGAIYTAAQTVDGVLYYGNSIGEVKAYNIESQRFIWRHNFNDPIYSTPIIYKDIIIVATLSEGLVALNLKNGRVVWRNTDGNCYIGNGIAEDGYLYIGTRGTMRKIDCSNGKTVWSFTFSDQHPQGRPTIAENRLIFGAWDCHLYCVDCHSGRELWRWNNGSQNRLFSPGHIIPRVANGRVMIVAPDRYITNIDLATGRELWRIKSRKVRESTGLSSDGKTFYAKTMDGEIIAVPMAADNYCELWCKEVGWGYDHNFCPLTVSDGVVYMANRRGKVAAIRENGDIVSVGKFTNSAANDLRVDANGDIWVSFIEGTIWRLSTRTDEMRKVKGER